MQLLFFRPFRTVPLLSFRLKSLKLFPSVPFRSPFLSVFLFRCLSVLFSFPFLSFSFSFLFSFSVSIYCCSRTNTTVLFPSVPVFVFSFVLSCFFSLSSFLSFASFFSYQAAAPDFSARAASRPEKFSGIVGKNVQQWLCTLDVYFQAIGLNDPTRKAAIAATFLEGDAITWWMSVMNQHPNIEWDEFQTLVKARYVPVEAMKIARDKLYDIKQFKSVADYCSRFQTVCNVLVGEMNEVHTVSLFVGGLQPEIRKFVELNDPSTLVEAMSVAQRVEHTNRGSARARQDNYRPNFRSNYFSSAPSTSVPMELGHLGTEEEEQQAIQEENATAEDYVNAAYDSRRFQTRPFFRGPNRGGMRRLDGATHQRRLRNNECFECGKQGHYGRDCSQRKQRSANVSAVTTQSKNA